jgi:hypothetical protein
MSSREQGHDEASLSAPTSTVTLATEVPLVAPTSEDGVIGTVEVEEAISPVRQQESDTTDLPQQRQRYLYSIAFSDDNGNVWREMDQIKIPAKANVADCDL